MKHEDVYKKVISKVGLKEDSEYKRLYNPKDLYGEALGQLSVRNLKRFIAVLYYLIVEKQIKFDLIIGAGDSGIALAKVIEIFYQLNDLKPPQILNMPITRFNYGFTLYDNSILIPEVKEELKSLKQIKNVLFVDDEIANGTTLSAALKVLVVSIEKKKISNPLKVYLVAEDQNFKTENFMDGIDIEMHPFAKEIKGLLTVIRYITPWSIQLKIREHFNDDQIGSKSLINLLLDVPIKETETIDGIKIPKAKYTYRERDLLKKEVPGFEGLQKKFRNQVEEWIKEAINEYKSSKIERKFPKIIEEVGFDFSWSEEKVWALDVPVEEMNLTELEWHFDIPFWNTKDGYYDLTPNEVLGNPEKYIEEYDRTMQADLIHPLDIMFWKNRWLLLDGLHRLVKANQLGKKTVSVRKIPKESIPLISKR